MAAFVEYTEPKWRNLNMRDLNVDEAYFILRSEFNSSSFFYVLTDACYKCPYTKVETFVEADKTTVLKLNIAQALNFKALDHDVGYYAFDNSTALCTVRRDELQEFAVYNLTLQANGTCSLLTDKLGVNIYNSLFSVLVLVAAALCILKICWCVWRTYRYDEAAVTAQIIDDVTTKAMQHKRMRSLDAFRGLAIVLMIFVNSGGGSYIWIEHALWNGLHLADVVFPSFIWIMGVCIPLSVKSQLSRGITKIRICFRIVSRAVKLFALGLCLNSIKGPQLEELRIMGVLQRFGISYLFCAIIHTFFSKREILPPHNHCQRFWLHLHMIKGELIVSLALIATHLGIIFGLNIPNCPKGYLGPGGKHDNAAYPSCVGGATGYIDRQILGEDHIYQHPTAKHIYDSTAFEVEGLFGCLLTIVHVFLGVLAGVTLLVYTDWRNRITNWIVYAILLGLLGGALSGFSQEEGIIPINKNLWSLSFVLVTTSLSFTLLALLYYFIDVCEFWSGYPFVESGMNAIIMYVGHTIMHKMLPWHWRVGVMNTHFMLLLESVWNTLLWIAIALYLNAIGFYYSL